MENNIIQKKNTRNLTVKQLSELIAEDYITATAFMKVLVKVGAAKEVGKQPAPGGRGKPSTIFEVEGEIELVLWEENEVAEQVEAATVPVETVTTSQVEMAAQAMTEASAELAAKEIVAPVQNVVDAAQ